MLVKVYSRVEENRERYSPSEVLEAIPIPVMGSTESQRISTSRVERQNLTVRMHLRGFTRLTNSFSKKLNHMKAALAPHFARYTFCTIQQSLRVTPAMAAGIADHIWDFTELFLNIHRTDGGSIGCELRFNKVFFYRLVF